MPEGRETDERATPPDLFARIVEWVGPLAMDVCATNDNKKCPRWIGREDNGLLALWDDRWFCNPPYSNILGWVNHAISMAAQGRTGVMLVRSDSSTVWWHRAMEAATQVVLLQPRVCYFSPAGVQLGSPNFGSALLVFDRRVAYGTPMVCVRRWRRWRL